MRDIYSVFAERDIRVFTHLPMGQPEGVPVELDPISMGRPFLPSPLMLYTQRGPKRVKRVERGWGDDGRYHYELIAVAEPAAKPRYRTYRATRRIHPK